MRTTVRQAVMGAWDTGPFDNDDAADFAASLDDLEPEDRACAIRCLLTRVAGEAGYLERDTGGAAVAMAVLVAASTVTTYPSIAFTDRRG